MSLQKRKLGYWSLEFAHGDNEFFDRDLFVGFMTYLSGLDTQSRLQRDSKNNKAIAIDRIWETDIQGAATYEIRFKSCKYNHSPDYMSSTDGSERPTEKQLYEGDKEVTHICMRIDALEVGSAEKCKKIGKRMRNLGFQRIIAHNVPKTPKLCYTVVRQI